MTISKKHARANERTNLKATPRLKEAKGSAETRTGSPANFQVNFEYPDTNQ
jgi:hypothetical protein